MKATKVKTYKYKSTLDGDVLEITAYDEAESLRVLYLLKGTQLGDCYSLIGAR